MVLGGNAWIVTMARVDCLGPDNLVNPTLLATVLQFYLSLVAIHVYMPPPPDGMSYHDIYAKSNTSIEIWTRHTKHTYGADNHSVKRTSTYTNIYRYIHYKQKLCSFSTFLLKKKLKVIQVISNARLYKTQNVLLQRITILQDSSKSPMQKDICRFPGYFIIFWQTEVIIHFQPNVTCSVQAQSLFAKVLQTDTRLQNACNP